MKQLMELRLDINRVDEDILALLTERSKIALSISAVKKQTNDTSVFYIPEREKNILQKIITQNQSKLKDEDIKKIFQDIVAACRNIQQPIKAAFLGPLYTFSHAAAIQCFGNVDFVPKNSIKEAILVTEQGLADYTIVPIENSSEGIVAATLDNLLTTSLIICNELIIPVHHYLVSKNENLAEISQVYSHPQALAQCQLWLEKNLPNASQFTAKSTAQAAILATREAGTAAIVSELALHNHPDLHILAKYIEDVPNNATRFYVLGKQITASTGRDKTSLIIYAPHEPGALAKILNIFASFKINLTLIESRPTKQQPWNYIFLLEIEGHQTEENISSALTHLNNNLTIYKLLGSFPRVLE